MLKEKYYKLLGLTSSASDQEVRKAYRKLAMRYHPDRNSDPKAHELFILLNEASDIILNKKDAPHLPIHKKSKGTTKETTKEEKEKRMKTARKRYQDQAKKEQIENDRFFYFLTNGKKWKNLKIIAISGAIISFLMIADLFLPRHFQEDEVTHYKLNFARSPSQEMLGIIKTKRKEKYMLSGMNYYVYAKSRAIYVESSWFFHNPIAIIARNKITPKKFNIHFNYYSFRWVIILLFIIPLFTYWYKRKEISFTFLFYISYYGISILMLLFIITGNRWAHLMTLGFF